MPETRFEEIMSLCEEETGTRESHGEGRLTRRAQETRGEARKEFRLVGDEKDGCVPEERAEVEWLLHREQTEGAI